MGQSDLGDIAIDDVGYKSGLCAYTPSQAVPPSVRMTTPTSTARTSPVTATSGEPVLLHGN